ncbi:S1/P1 nuclease [Candidatus Kryptobacter tengchongensis]|uniref:S1/P1 nuclease n=1 Tax=Kryptobacter tengchongensis TaxID=1643429 RepID=UPI000707B3C2|nr:S1/P1 nuclease [Candidatus Kryptobacter tengchongensis]CUS89205.1 S1/P1 Nuclease [Candidatus Kryptobacter tengchongensis]
MRKYKNLHFIVYFISVILIFFVLKFQNAQSWGFDAHKKITELAIDLILSIDEFNGIDQSKLNSLKKFLSENRSIIIERCIEPDMIRNEDKEEQFNHFIDIDRYGKYPFDELPRDKQKAIEKFGFETVQKNGLLPWRISDFTDSLAYSIYKWERDKMLKYLSWLAHYVEDAHQPLHVTENYDGQLTGQPGIHSRFETELVRYMMQNDELKFDIKKIKENLKESSIIKDRVKFAFDIVLESYRFLEEILSADNYAKSQIPPEKLYRVEKRNGRTRYIYSDEYYSIMSKKLGEVVHGRMTLASVRLATLWLTAMAESLKYK